MNNISIETNPEALDILHEFKVKNEAAAKIKSMKLPILMALN